eukprot:6569306-Lingulodinium_polyedra.AAC.1
MALPLPFLGVVVPLPLPLPLPFPLPLPVPLPQHQITASTPPSFLEPFGSIRGGVPALIEAAWPAASRLHQRLVAARGG